MNAAFANAANTNTSAKPAMSNRGESADGRSLRISNEIHTRRDCHQADVVVRAGADAIEAKRAVEVSRFTREIQICFAARLERISAQTIVCFAVGANSRLADFDFERRNQ